MRKSGYSGFPSILLTFSLLLVVLGAGFVFGLVVVARAYPSIGPKIEPQAGAEGEEALTPERAGRVYLPPPTPPAHAPDEEQTEHPAREPNEEALSEAPEVTPEPVEVTPPRAEEAPPGPARTQTPEPPAEETSNQTYSIQVGVFTSRGGARQVVDELARAGFPSRIAVQSRGNQELYRVVTGRYRSEYAARKALDQLRSEGFEAFLVRE
jgi:cell division protein FtsN